MSVPGFVHLHNHSEFSLLDGACRIKDMVNRAVELEMPAIALTDHGVMYGNINFYNTAKSAGIKPILGCEVYVAPRSRTDKDSKLDRDLYHLVLLAKSEAGYKNLIKLVSIAYQEGFYYKPRVDKELLSQYSDGLIAMSACLGGEIPNAVMRGDSAAVDKSVNEYVDIFGKDDFYLELQDHFLPEQKSVNKALIDISSKTGIKLAVTNDVHYIYKKDSASHDVLLCIQTGQTITDPNRLRFDSQEFYLKSAEEMSLLFPNVPSALENTLEIADKCNCNFDFNHSSMPDPGIPENLTAGEYMASEAYDGLRKRLKREIPEEYRAQLDYEIDLINKLGFPTYMLIVRDFTNYARNTGIYVGARGSAAASLVSYGLGITDVDPIEYGLAFERFLNPERIEMPDVDLDIQDDRRDELIQYVIQKYGQDRVGQIATFGSMKARGAVRDCGRVMGIPLAEVDHICKMIPASLGITIEQAIEENPDLKAEYENNEDIRNLLDTAQTLEGLNRSVGVHAAGVLISDDPLTDHVPVHFGGKGEIVAQLDKEDIKKIGLLKMDFLGLANLTILAESVKNVKAHRGIDIDIMEIPLDDPKVFEMLGNGDTNGVFQLEGGGMRKYVTDLKPNSIRELAAMVALYRPGPMAFIPNFIRAKFGKDPIVYLHPLLEPILEETYGVICYQEQVLSIARAIAGFTMGQADVLRKGMSSKKKEIMDQQRVKFLDGARKNGIDEEIAVKIYEQIEPFAGYAFNKAHAVCYAFVAYRTAYMKANYPVEYYAALLSANMDDKMKLAMYIDDCSRFKINILPPDVNKSEFIFSVEDDSIRFGLGAIKNVGKGVIDAIVETRKNSGEFTSLYDFCRRTIDSSVGKGAVECLIKAGAFDSINSNRAQMLFIMDEAVSMASRENNDRKSGQVSLFDCVEEESVSYMEPSSLPQVTDFNSDEKLTMEKELLGLYLSDHPLKRFSEFLASSVNATSEDVKDKQEREDVTVGGIITKVKVITTKKGEMMGIVTLEDMIGQIDVTLFPKSFQQYRMLLKEDAIVIVKGKVNRRERSFGGEETVEISVLCDSVTPVNNVVNGSGNGEPKPEHQRAVNIRINGLARPDIKTLKDMIGINSGDCNVYFHVTANGMPTKVYIDLKVDPNPRFLNDVERVVGKECVWLD